GDQVQVAAHRPEEAFGKFEAAVFLAREEACLNQVCRPVDAVNVTGNPIERVKVAQAALAVLDVGLDQITAVAKLQVTLVAFSKFGADELGARAGHDLLAEECGTIVEQLFITPDPSRLEESRADGDVVLR